MYKLLLIIISLVFILPSCITKMHTSDIKKKYHPAYEFSEIDKADTNYIVAKEKGLSLAQLFRESVFVKIENPPKRIDPRPKIIYKQTDPDLLCKLEKISVAINQILKHLKNGENVLNLKVLYKIYEEVMKL